MYASKVFQVLIIVMSLSLGACNNQDSENTETTTSQENNVSGSVDMEIDNEVKEQAIFSYLDLKNALVETNAESAAEAAEKLATLTSKSKNELVQNVHSAAIHIVDSRDVEQQREYFEVLSEHLYILVKATGSDDKILYKQYCPMAFNNKGAYWLSSEKEIRNPYFGNKMLHCGKVEESIE